ncbi:hypothetical protein [Streptomyces sp. NPDC005423]|uniref:hypothetical protein n=1 Tax=Streptomyces sp. NPDC005423 TaxID=3155343 RepID=UPI0033A1FE35
MTTPEHDEKWANIAKRVFGQDGHEAAWQGRGAPSRPFKVMVNGEEFDYGARLAQVKSFAMTRGHDYAGPREAEVLRIAGASMTAVQGWGYKVTPGSMLPAYSSKARENHAEYAQAIYQAVAEGTFKKGQIPPESLVVVLSETGKPVAIGGRLAGLAKRNSPATVSDPEKVALEFAQIGLVSRVNPAGRPLKGLQINPDTAREVDRNNAFVFQGGTEQGQGQGQDTFSHQMPADYTDFAAVSWDSWPEMGFVQGPMVQEPASYQMPADSGYIHDFAAALGDLGTEHLQGYGQGLGQPGYANLSVMPQFALPWPSQYFADGAALNYVTPAEALRAAAGPAAALQDQHPAEWQRFDVAQNFGPHGNAPWPTEPGTSSFAGYAGQLQPDLNGRDQSHAASHDPAAQRQYLNSQQGGQQEARRWAR